MRRNSIYTGILLVVLSSCSGYEKVLKSTDYNFKYKKAFEYYNKGDYSRASGVFEQIANVFRGSSKSDSVSFFQGMAAYKQKDYINAQYYFSTFVQTYSYSPFAEEAEYLASYCLYLDSPNPALDQESTMKGIEALQSFMRKYPKSRFYDNAKQYMIELQDKMVEKSYLSAKLYYHMGGIMLKSAIVALKSSLEEFPNNKFREEMMWLVLDANFQIAENSVEAKKKDRYLTTLDEYYSFVSEFPESKWKKDAQKIYEKSEKFSK
jgi:outer membrane protein assembly factor BamD